MEYHVLEINKFGVLEKLITLKFCFLNSKINCNVLHLQVCEYLLKIKIILDSF